VNEIKFFTSYVPTFMLRLPEYLCSMSCTLLSFTLWLKAPVNPHSTADTHAVTAQTSWKLASLFTL